VYVLGPHLDNLYILNVKILKASKEQYDFMADLTEIGDRSVYEICET